LTINRIEIISDTHSLLREEALRALQGSDLIFHAGDVGKPGILDTLQALAPLVAVRGNIDKGTWAEALPPTAVAETPSAVFYVLHDLQQLDRDPKAARFHIVVSGHTETPGYSQRGGVLYLNPGSSGPRRFNLPVTLARLDLLHKPWKPEFVNLSTSANYCKQRR